MIEFWGLGVFKKYILGVRSLSDRWFASIFSQAMVCLFILLFQRTEVLNSDKAQFTNMNHAAYSITHFCEIFT